MIVECVHSLLMMFKMFMLFVVFQDVSCRRLSVPVAVIFIVGTMCGSGILALPLALVQSGWFGEN